MRNFKTDASGSDSISSLSDTAGYRTHHILYSVRPISRTDLWNAQKESGRVIVAGVDDSPVGAWASAEVEFQPGGGAGVS
jgi:hypothetical protein